jgi:hypothetical protein
VEFDDNFAATGRGGAVLLEQVMRSLGVRRVLSAGLPCRGGEYSSADVVEQVMEGLLCAGKGFQAAQVLRRDPLLMQIFGHEKVAEEATVYRAMCDLAGLNQRTLSDAYVPVEFETPSLNIYGEEVAARKHRRVVPDVAERMDSGRREAMSLVLRTLAARCGKTLQQKVFSLFGFAPIHGDGTDLEVEGRCFDAARTDRHGNRSLKLMSVSCGPICAALDVMEGATDEGNALPSLLAESESVVNELRGQRRVLSLLDAAFAELGVINEVQRLQWNYIVCANQWREVLERLAKEIADAEWASQGPDPSRGWSESQLAVFTHLPEGWSTVQTVIVRRWHERDELACAPWHYAFLYTDLRPEDLPADKRRRYGYAQLIWMLYSTKQGHEHNYKPLLSDLGLHHPPSGRLGATQAFAFVCAMTANVQAVISLCVVDAKDRGIRAWRFVRDYVIIAAQIVVGAGRRLIVRLAGAALDDPFKAAWLQAYENAKRL